MYWRIIVLMELKVRMGFKRCLYKIGIFIWVRWLVWLRLMRIFKGIISRKVNRMIQKDKFKRRGNKSNSNKIMEWISRKLILMMIKKLISQIHIYLLVLIRCLNLIIISHQFMIAYFTLTARKVFGDILMVNNQNFLWHIYWKDKMNLHVNKCIY